MINYFSLLISFSLVNSNNSIPETPLNWNSFSGDYSCSSSNYIKTKPQTFIFVSRRVDGRNMVRFHNELWPLSTEKADRAIIYFNDSTSATITTNDATTNGKTKLRGFTAIVDDKLRERISTEKVIKIKYITDDIVKFPSQGLDIIYTNLINCAKKLKTHGYSENQIPVSSPVLMPGFSIKKSDYPKSAKKLRKKVRVKFKVLVNPEGKPIGCKITSSSGNTELDDKTCELLLKRSRYKPARNGNSEPVADYYNSRIIW